MTIINVNHQPCHQVILKQKQELKQELKRIRVQSLKPPYLIKLGGDAIRYWLLGAIDGEVSPKEVIIIICND
jgi:hypothetical protein